MSDMFSDTPEDRDPPAKGVGRERPVAPRTPPRSQSPRSQSPRSPAAPSPRPPSLAPRSLAHRRRQLIARLNDLGARLSGIGAELGDHNAKDWEELATLREGDEVLERIGRSGLGEIRQITAALRRMDEGEYGYCLRCGTAIARARLDLLPHTPYCSACAGSARKDSR